MKKKRKNYTPQEKVVILKKHLVDQIPVSDLCNQYNLQPAVFYGWQKKFFENGAAAFEKNTSGKIINHSLGMCPLFLYLFKFHTVAMEGI